MKLVKRITTFGYINFIIITYRRVFPIKIRKQQVGYGDSKIQDIF